MPKQLAVNHVLLDIACGSLRGGVHFIPYLEAGHYLGLDRDEKLIELGVRHELGAEMLALKQPEFVGSDRFEFTRFSRRPDFSFAQSLFTHLTTGDIRLCLSNLRAFTTPGHVLFATFYPGHPGSNPERSHSQQRFFYCTDAMERIGHENGWRPVYLGEWRHPRRQMMMRYEAV